MVSLFFFYMEAPVAEQSQFTGNILTQINGESLFLISVGVDRVPPMLSFKRIRPYPISTGVESRTAKTLGQEPASPTLNRAIRLTVIFSPIFAICAVIISPTVVELSLTKGCSSSATSFSPERS